MKRRAIIISLVSIIVTMLLAFIILLAIDTDESLDAVQVNEIMQSVQSEWDVMETYQNNTELDYAVLDTDGNIIYMTKQGISMSINQAVRHRDTMLDIVVDGKIVGKLIIYNDSAEQILVWKQTAAIVFAIAALLQCIICTLYTAHLNRVIIRPFQKLDAFAEHVARGNLDVPLEMDRQNLFGAFTESFDIMRSELKKARSAEAKANASKKELVAKLSHDIKTPVASIKAVSEVGMALANDEKTKENYMQIVRKADQINELVSNLFTATLEELQQLTVTPGDMASSEIKEMLENADYLHRAEIADIPECVIYADKLRLQQVFDNIFSNSYKYANTGITVDILLENNHLIVGIEDFGGGVVEQELLLIKEKFKRGSNARGIDGAGLGLYISDYFMREMQGALVVENGTRGFRVSAAISLSGTI